MSNACGCGCGAIAKNKFIHGHNTRLRIGERHPLWNGGRHERGDGYVEVLTPTGYRKEHVVIAERTLGRPLRRFGWNDNRNEEVHHINGRRNDNRNANLLICTRAYHRALHRRLQQSDQWPQFSWKPRRLPSLPPTGFRGVHISGDGFRAQFKNKHLGVFKVAKDAARAYDAAATAAFGQNAVTNEALGLL